MAFDAHVGVLLRDPEVENPPESLEHNEVLLQHINIALARRGLPLHEEPRWIDEIRPPLKDRGAAGNLGQRLGFYGSEKYSRLCALAMFIAVEHRPPSRTLLDSAADLSQRYDAISDRTQAFDHVLAMLCLSTVLLPRDLPHVLHLAEEAFEPAKHPAIYRIASAPRLLTECVLLANVLRYYGEDSREYNWLLDTEQGDPAWGGLRGRIQDDRDVIQEWAEEADLCWRLAQVAKDALRIGGMAVTS